MANAQEVAAIRIFSLFFVDDFSLYANLLHVTIEHIAPEGGGTKTGARMEDGVWRMEGEGAGENGGWKMADGKRAFWTSLQRSVCGSAGDANHKMWCIVPRNLQGWLRRSVALPNHAW